MTESVERKRQGPAGPVRPAMDPAEGVRQIKLRPHEMTDAVTNADDLFVLAHLGIPRVDPTRWSLTIDGMVGSTRTLTLDDVKARPKKLVEAVHQCCGNPLQPQVATRRVANVRWGGIDLMALLDELGIDPGARFLWSYGLDGGEFAGKSCEWFIKDLPLDRLAAGDVLLAYELDGAALPAEHGFPLRLVVPGYYGTNSVKWLWRLHLAEHRADGIFTTEFYNDGLSAEDMAAGLPSRRPVWAVAPESIIVAPAPDAAVALGELTEIWGWAWSFRGIAAAEISVDGGANYVRATLDARHGWAWQRFSLPWRPADRGETQIGSALWRVEAQDSRSRMRATRFIWCGSSCDDRDRRMRRAQKMAELPIGRFARPADRRAARLRRGRPGPQPVDFGTSRTPGMPSKCRSQVSRSAPCARAVA